MSQAVSPWSGFCWSLSREERFGIALFICSPASAYRVDTFLTSHQL
jgi:hypothetical protein